MAERVFNYYWLSKKQLDTLKDEFYKPDKRGTMHFDWGFRVRMHLGNPISHAHGIERSQLYEEATVEVSQEVYDDICKILKVSELTVDMNLQAESLYNHFVVIHKGQEESQTYKETQAILNEHRSAMNVLNMRVKQ